VRDVLKNVAEVEVTPTPILVFANAFVTVRGPVKGVVVINKKYLLETLQRGRPVELPRETIVGVLTRKMGRRDRAG
jgi:hypothetical protein